MSEDIVPHLERRAPTSRRMRSFLEPGRNCWCLARADCFSVIVDAATYFDAVAEAIERAEHSVLIVGWDVHGETPLRAGEDATTLADVLENAARRRPELSIKLLVWDFIFFYALERELFPALRRGWHNHPTIDFRFAADHPIGGSHHQKVVVVDDAIAFAGGIDLTVARWDEATHPARTSERRLPNGSSYPPLHDVQVAVTGDAARCLGDLARARWKSATGQELPRPPTVEAQWPAGLKATVEDVEVGIARTAPAAPGRQPVREIRQLHLDMIEAAERVIYVENQYLTASCVRDALAERLREPNGPEVVIVTPKRQVGRLEVRTLGVLRTRWLALLRQHDRYGRLRVVHPLAAGDPSVPVNVHSKVMIVDDQILRVGSANFTNRSMGLDTECDVVIAANGDPRIEQAIAQMRGELLAHSLGLDGPVNESSLVALIDARSNERYEVLDLSAIEASPEPVIADDVVDPIEPMDAALARSVLPTSLQREGRRRLPRILFLVMALLVLAAMWAWTPLRDWVEPDRLAGFALGLQGSTLGAVGFVVIMAIASLLMVPITALIVAGALLFGPAVGVVCGLVGSMASAAMGFGLGRRFFHRELHERGGRRIAQLSRAIERRGVLSVLAVRVVPVAPFTVVNLVAGASHVRFRDYVLGTFLGMLPGLVGLTVAADRVAAAVRSPDVTTVIVAAVIVVVVAATLYLMRRWLTRVATRGG